MLKKLCDAYVKRKQSKGADISKCVHFITGLIFETELTDNENSRFFQGSLDQYLKQVTICTMMFNTSVYIDLKINL